AYPENRTHYLNILHASWPAGLVLGGIVGWTLDDKFQWDWKWQLALYLVPTVIYGLMFFGQKYPKSEASEKGMSIGDMFKDVGLLGGLVICYLLAMFFAGMLTPILAESFIPENATPQAIEEGAAKAASVSKWIGYGIGFVLLAVIGVITKFSIGSVLLFVLFITHAMVGAVELGTDGWIQNITGNLFTSESGKWLFIWTSAIMFALRFCAEWIETKLKLSPVALLFVCSVLAFIGLQLAGGMTTLMVAFGALGLYAIGKTFFWPTMLAVASDRFPRTGAVAISIMGGIGMMSAGLIGSPGLGYLKDRYAGQDLQEADAALYAEYKAEKPSYFLNLASTEATGLDGGKLGEVQGKLADARGILAAGEVPPLDPASLEGLSDEEKKAAQDKQAAKEAIAATLKEAGVLQEGGTKDMTLALKALSPAEAQVQASSIVGDRKTLKADSLIPLTMALIYIGLIIYFKSIGGYKPVRIDEAHSISEGEALKTGEG
ncbi:MAG: hypothetical protein HKN23_00190, partial [Verrucomicrobiales bacterium]|nr:hypothetical protein [Verrucomicrobiales bacterium]